MTEPDPYSMLLTFSKLLASSQIMLLLILSGVSLSTHAQSSGQDEALSFKLGETDLFPSLRVDYLQNSNAFLEPSDELSTSEVVISPELVWIADRRLLSLQGAYRGKYNISSEDTLSFADHRFALNTEAELSSRKRLSGDITLNFGHEDLGTNLTQGEQAKGDDLVQFIDFLADGSFRYGANGAKGNVTVGALLENFSYSNRDDVTTGRGFIQIEPYAEFSYRLGGDTRLLSQIRYAAVRFDNSDRDRDDLSLLAGLSFDSTGKSGGFFSVGAVRSASKRSGVDDQTEFVFRADLFWEPTSFSKFTLQGIRSLDNRDGSLVNANAIAAVEDLISLQWNHSWSSRVEHIAVLRSRTITRTCPDLDASIMTAGLELNVQLRRWLSVGLSGSGATRELSDCSDALETDLDYQRTLIGAHLRATL